MASSSYESARPTGLALNLAEAPKLALGYEPAVTDLLRTQTAADRELTHASCGEAEAAGYFAQGVQLHLCRLAPLVVSLSLPAEDVCAEPVDIGIAGPGVSERPSARATDTDLTRTFVGGYGVLLHAPNPSARTMVCQA